MDIIQVHDKKFIPFLTASEISTQVKRIAGRINHDYADKQPVFIAILNGSFIFAADLVRELTIASELCFIKLASYKGTKSSGHVITSIGLDADLYNRDVVIVEDIIDTGKTLHKFLPQLIHQHPRTLAICALLHKPEATVYPLDIKYLGFTIPNKFVVGYGLDYDGLGRNIPGIYSVVDG